MKRYNQPRISVSAALGAVLATCATIGVAVLLPAKLAPSDAPALAMHQVAIIPSIEVIGYRTEQTRPNPALVETREARESAGVPKS